MLNKKSNEIEVQWQSHCTGDTPNTCSGRVPEEYIVRYRFDVGKNEMYNSVKADVAGTSLPMSKLTLSSLKSNTQYLIAVRSKIHLPDSNGKTINSDFSDDQPVITSKY